jgi:CBS domain containing-hemolysin-like protein
MPDVLRLVASSPYSRLPVYRRTLDEIAGILHTKEAVLHFIDRGPTGSLALLVRPIPRVPDSMPADRLLAFLRERRSHQAIVVDASSRVAGLITLEDVLGELVGSVADEFKGQRLLPLRLTDGRVRLPGALPMDLARLWVNGAWPDDQRTVGDFIIRQVGRLPESSEELTVAGLPVEIEAIENNMIASVIVTPPAGGALT